MNPRTKKYEFNDNAVPLSIEDKYQLSQEAQLASMDYLQAKKENINSVDALEILLNCGILQLTNAMENWCAATITDFDKLLENVTTQLQSGYKDIQRYKEEFRNAETKKENCTTH